MKATVGLFALLGFTLCLFAHLSALVGIDVQSVVPGVWLLGPASLLVFIPTIVHLRSSSKDSGSSAVLQGVPIWVGVLVAVLFIYAFINFFVSFGGHLEGSPAERDGSYVLERKGKVVREITVSEYQALRIAEVRGVTGHVLLFYFVPFAHFLLRRREQSYA